ncbi:MAG: nicotinate-nucleotide adenylyltransferase [Defluviitaleaceae bacterium]|nr:nicotinate-nucleotide adenylyltransferase [Defluviitaleaceae bacterium]
MKNDKKSKKINNIAIMGGTFDPIHNGHLNVAISVLDKFDLDKILFIPAGTSPFKNNSDKNKEHRYNMVSIAISKFDNFEASDIEIKRKGISFTIDTINELRKEYTGKIYFILGFDVLHDIYKFKNINDIFKMCEFILVNRFNEVYPKNVINFMKKDGAILHFLKIPNFEISSTQIRENIEREKSINIFVPKKVEEYIKKHNLYKEDIKFDFENVKNHLKKILSKKRYEHVLGVCDCAISLAKNYKISEIKAYIAAILHDYAKEYTEEEIKTACFKYDYKPDYFVRENIGLYHGPLAAKIANKDFGIQDKDILNAICYHTTARENMSLLEKIIYVADTIEINRGVNEELNEIRKLAYENIDKAILCILEYTFNKSIQKGQIYHVLGLKAMTYFKEILSE